MKYPKVKLAVVLAMLLTPAVSGWCWAEGNLQDLACLCKQEGDRLLHQGETQEAIRAYQKALAQNRKLAPAWFNMAIAFYTQRDVDRAAFALRRLVSLQPRDSEAHYNLGCLNLYRGNIHEARKEFEKARRSLPGESFLAEQIDRAFLFLELFENSSALQQRKILQMLQDGLQPLTSA